ncbi:helicase-associated domain-containing protein [Candidatus Sumerlaeota bacterium]|nr:helicase-associated domain-containing protein [Candidatus Sumerlaeota bacterium]
MKLLSILKQLDLGTLESVREYWEIQSPPIPEKGINDKVRHKKLMEYLYPRLQIEQYFHQAFNKLDKDEKNLIYFLTIHGGDLEESEVSERCFKGNAEELKNLVAILSKKGFVFYDNLSEDNVNIIMVGIPEPYLRFIDLPTYWEGYLGYFLKDRSTQQLKSMVTDGLKLKPISSRKNYLLLFIRDFLLNPEKLNRYIHTLPQMERSIFENLLSKKGVCVYRDLLATGYQKRYDHSKADYVNNLLSTSGLVFTAVPDSNKYNNLLMIPRDIYQIITHDFKPDNRTLNDLDTVSLVGEDAAPNIILDNSNMLMRDLVIFASYINRNIVKTLSNGGIGKNDLKKILPFLSANKNMKYISFLALFCIVKKFILGVSGVWKVTNNFVKWLSDSQQAYRDLYQFWLETNEWNEEYVEGDTIHAEMFPTNLINISELRKLVIRNLASIPYRRWIRFSAFMEGVLPQIEINIPNRGSQLVMEKYNRSNYLIVESIIAETMYWMGLVALGLQSQKDKERLGSRIIDIPQFHHKKLKRKRQKGLEIEFYCKPTELGRHILENENPFEPQNFFQKKQKDIIQPLNYEVQHFIVQPNLDVITPPDLNLQTFYHLNEFANIKNIDVMSTLTITRDSLREGMDKGLRGEDVLAFLNEACRPGLPETVKHLITECSEKHGEVYMGFAGGYIRVDDPILLEDLRSHKKIQVSIKDIIDKKVILLNPNVDVKKLAKDLQRLGFMPQLDSERVHITSDQKYHLTLSREDLFYLIASLRFLLFIEESLEANLTEDKVAPLLEHLKPDPATFYQINFYAEALFKSFSKHFQNALKKKINLSTSKYKKQVSSLIATSVPRMPTKYSFTGPNPATNISDIKDMIDFAIDHDFQMQIEYVTMSKKTISEDISPESLDQDKIYAYCDKKDIYKIFSVKRIQKATLL